MKNLLFKDKKIESFYDEKPFGLYNYLDHSINLSDDFDYIELQNGDKFKLVQDEENQFFEDKPFNGHETLISEKFKLDIKEALKLLTGFVDEYDFFKRNVDIIWPLRRKDNAQVSELTSSIYPKMTDTIFISQKANIHVPPVNISKKENKYILAENLFHEAIHLFVNKLILNYELIKASIAPVDHKFEIPWRRNSSKRNQYWEIDRVLHAASVYSCLIDFRAQVIKKTDSDKEINRFFVDSVESAKENYTYLKDILMQNTDLFTDFGNEYIKNV